MSEDSIDLSAQSRGRATANAARTDSGGRLIKPSPLSERDLLTQANVDTRVDRTDSQVQSCDVSEKRLRRVRDALFVDAETLRVNCGSCGKDLLVKLEDMREARTIDCEECSLKAKAPIRAKVPIR